MSQQATMQREGLVWDLTSFFPEFNGPEMKQFKQTLIAEIGELQQRAAALDALSPETADAWEKLLVDEEDWASRFHHLYAYVGCLSSADASNEQYAQEEASLGLIGSLSVKLDVDLLRAFKDVDDAFFDEFVTRESLNDMEYQLRRLRQRASKTMEPALEKLTADLNVDGFHSWGRLYDTITGKLEWQMEYPDGKVETKPISAWRSLMANRDFEVGRAAFEGGNKAWAGISDVCAAALNAISGTRLTLNRYRGYDHFLEPALFSARISRETLDAMYEAIHNSLPLARRIFKEKCAFTGREGIWWFEREAPLLIEANSSYSWDECHAMVHRSFAKVYPELADYYESFIKNGWMESEARGGKRPGAYCTGSAYTGEQRVYSTFNGSLSDITTVAHEIGHAFHSHLLKHKRPTAQNYPMTLAETASIFAEHILAEGIYADDGIDDDAKLLMLDADLCGAAVLLLDITTRFEFEKKFHEERMNGELSVTRFKELMTETQREVMGDAMVEGGEDPLFWASKLHFYITGVTFYNFPYTFGFLLAKALAALFHEKGADFLPQYADFLRLTGSASVEDVAMQSIGADTTDPAFWAKSISALESPLEKYAGLLAVRKK